MRDDWSALSDNGGPSKMSRQSFMLSIAAMKLSTVRSRPAFSSAATVKLAAV